MGVYHGQGHDASLALMAPRLVLMRPSTPPGRAHASSRKLRAPLLYPHLSNAPGQEVTSRSLSNCVLHRCRPQGRCAVAESTAMHAVSKPSLLGDSTWRQAQVLSNGVAHRCRPQRRCAAAGPAAIHAASKPSLLGDSTWHRAQAQQAFVRMPGRARPVHPAPAAAAATAERSCFVQCQPVLLVRHALEHLVIHCRCFC